MATKTLDAIYEHGVVKPKVRLPFKERARLKLTIVMPTGRARRLRSVIKVSPQPARAITKPPTPWTDATRGFMKVSKPLARRLAHDPSLSAWNS